jgi:hypothetical protein
MPERIIHSEGKAYIIHSSICRVKLFSLINMVMLYRLILLRNIKVEKIGENGNGILA